MSDQHVLLQVRERELGHHTVASLKKRFDALDLSGNGLLELNEVSLQHVVIERLGRARNQRIESVECSSDCHMC